MLYTGNYGWGHDLAVLFEYARRHPGQRTFYFLFVGGGEKWQSLLDFKAADGAACLGVKSYVPKERVAVLIRRPISAWRPWTTHASG